MNLCYIYQSCLLHNRIPLLLLTNHSMSILELSNLHHPFIMASKAICDLHHRSIPCHELFLLTYKEVLGYYRAISCYTSTCKHYYSNFYCGFTLSSAILQLLASVGLSPTSAILCGFRITDTMII